MGFGTHLFIIMIIIIMCYGVDNNDLACIVSSEYLLDSWYLKTGDAKKIKDYRPISMADCTYKTIAKVLTSQMKRVMDGLVGESYISFFKVGRL